MFLSCAIVSFSSVRRFSVFVSKVIHAREVEFIGVEFGVCSRKKKSASRMEQESPIKPSDQNPMVSLCVHITTYMIVKLHPHDRSHVRVPIAHTALGRVTYSRSSLIHARLDFPCGVLVGRSISSAF